MAKKNNNAIDQVHSVKNPGNANTGKTGSGNADDRPSGFMPQFLKTRKAGWILITLYLLLGLFLVRDYGVSFDENYSREDSLVAYNYMMKLENSESESVRAFSESIPSFDLYPEKHSTALHFPLVVIEHLNNFELPTQTIYLMRHVFMFLNYILAAFCFHAILWRRFPKTLLPLAGVLLFILYPRFFAEAFYNNKDVLFYAWYIISVDTVLRWLEKPSWPKTLLAGAALAIAANTRILALSVLLLAIAFYIARALLEKKKALTVILPPIKLAVIFLALYTIITPHTWKNPLTGIFEIFSFFLHFNPWDGQHLYLGEWITKDVPWHYIPVWISVTSPLLYTVLFLIGNTAYVSAAVRDKFKLRPLLFEHMGDSFFFALFWCTLFGFIGFGIFMYNGWRHAYSIFCPFLFIAVYGLGAAFACLKQRHNVVRYVAAAAVAASMITTAGWIALNHPYQYTYFNILAAPYAAENFDHDYWGVSGNASLDYVLENDSRDYITVLPPHPTTWYLLKEQDQKRVAWLDDPLSWTDYHFFPTAQPEHPYSPDYIIPNLQGNILPVIPGYQGIHDIEAGGMTISRLYKNMALDSFDDKVLQNVRSVSGTVGNGDYAAMFDDSPKTRWTTNAPQRAGDRLQIEFTNPVQYNFFRLDVGSQLNDYMVGRILVSSDGETWHDAQILWNNCVDYLISSPPYKYLCFLNDTPDANYWWSIYQLRFGTVDTAWYR